MQINKAWLTSLISYYLGIIGVKWGITFGNEAADMAAGFVIFVVIPALSAFLNKLRAKKTEKPVRPQDVDPDTYVQGG